MYIFFFYNREILPISLAHLQNITKHLNGNHLFEGKQRKLHSFKIIRKYGNTFYIEIAMVF